MAPLATLHATTTLSLQFGKSKSNYSLYRQSLYQAISLWRILVVKKSGSSTTVQPYTLTQSYCWQTLTFRAAYKVAAAQVMEYLTLHDIPQRHCNPVHSHRMASQSGERPVAHMAAVCDIFSFGSTSNPENPEKRPLFLPPHSPQRSELFAKVSGSRKKAPQQHLPLKEITLSKLSPAFPSTPSDPCSTSHPLSLLDITMGILHLPDHPPNTACTRAEWDEYLDWCSTKTASQTYLQRSSPPLQPGEQSFPGKLPSFDEVSTV